jgi:hypothetical protein
VTEADITGGFYLVPMDQISPTLSNKTAQCTENGNAGLKEQDSQ